MAHCLHVEVRFRKYAPSAGAGRGFATANLSFAAPLCWFRDATGSWRCSQGQMCCLALVAIVTNVMDLSFLCEAFGGFLWL